MATDERAHGNISRTNGPSLAKPPLGTPLPASAAATVAAPVPAEEGGGHLLVVAGEGGAIAAIDVGNRQKVGYRVIYLTCPPYSCQYS